VNVKRNVHTVNRCKILKYIDNFILQILEDIVMFIESFQMRKRADCEECSPTEIETVFGFRQNAADRPGGPKLAARGDNSGRRFTECTAPRANERPAFVPRAKRASFGRNDLPKLTRMGITALGRPKNILIADRVEPTRKASLFGESTFTGGLHRVTSRP